MKQAILTLINRDAKGNPIGELDLTMAFGKTLTDPSLISSFRFTFTPKWAPAPDEVTFYLICNDAVAFFRLLANIMDPSPVLPATATRFNTTDVDGNAIGVVEIKATLYNYFVSSARFAKQLTAARAGLTTYFSYSFLLNNQQELGFLLGSYDADVFYYDFDCFLSTNPPNPE